MPQLVLVPLDRPEVAPKAISPRLRSQLLYFATAPKDLPGMDEFQFDPAEVARWLDEGVIELVSPLDTANMTEVELSEEQETLLGWLVQEKVMHVRVEER